PNAPLGSWLMSPICWSALFGPLSPWSTRDVTVGGDLMDFPILDLMDQHACYQRLLGLLHPQGLACPRCGGRDRPTVHRRRRNSPVVDYRCRGCRRTFNLFTGTPWQGTHRTPAQVLLILRGFVQGTPTARLARELHASRPHLLELRHQLQAGAAAASDR